tara:strand:+ start:26813 stop:26932 length:120 start_codon:yes stop_codon:yes gene_type:complete
MDVPEGDLPDYIPGASATIKNSIFKVKGSERLKAVEQIS